MTSLPPGQAPFHFEARVGQRSKGRSAVAAASYRAAAKLTDQRTGRTWDYSRKRHVEDRCFLAPEGAPDWCRDRSALWNRVEAGGRKNEVVYREVEVGIPRDLPRELWRPFIEAVVSPYVAAGAVADICIHTPPASDGDDQPHAHVLLTTRVLAADGNGFGPKNTVLECMFESGGRHPGKPGEALIRERERAAEVMNQFLRRCGSNRRVDHRSNRERGLARAPEPTIGTRDMERYRRQGERRPSRRQQHVGALRQARKLENAILMTEVEMVKESGRAFSGNKQEIKAALLRDRLGPDMPVDASDLHMVDVSKNDRTRVQFDDKSWAEIDHAGGKIRTWGKKGGAAATFAAAAADAAGWDRDTVEWLPECLRAAGPQRRARPLTADEAGTLADRWRERGYTDVYPARDGVWIDIGSTKLHDTGDRVSVHGRTTDDAVKALVDKAKNDWNGSMKVRGDVDFCSRVWLESQRQGVTVTNFEPPAPVRQQWEAEQARTQRQTATVASVADKATVARSALAYARGEVEQPPSPEIGRAIDALPPADRHRLARSEPYEIIPRLDALRKAGAEIEPAGAAAAPADVKKPEDPAVGPAAGPKGPR